ncbi:MAG: mercuric reductase [Anaerolineaceae bacterium]|nr:mercuric reductase [Anaerolineaceae bacterium]
MLTQFDAIIIGSGQGGTPLATALANAGWNTALVEAQFIGGTCINTGCTPTKTMIASAQAAHAVRNSASFGVHSQPARVAMDEIVRRKRTIVEQFRSGSERRVHQPEKLEWIQGEARFVGEKQLEVRLNAGGSRQISAPTIVIDTGTSPTQPRIPGVSEIPYYTSTTLMELEEIPGHLLILGGGYIGVEFAQMYRRFGSQVTLIQRSPHLLSHEDDDVSEEVEAILEGEGVQLRLGTTIDQARQAGGQVELLTTAGQASPIQGTHLLVATGRKPNTGKLNLGATGVQIDSRGYVTVDERLETNVPGIYAVGDVNGEPAFTHISYDDYRILKRNLLEGGGASTQGRLVPYVVFLDPQLGRVGLTEKQASQQGLHFKTAKIPASYISRAAETGDTRGLMKALVDADSGQILGCAILAGQGGEIAAMIEIAMLAKLPYPALKEGIFAHPTFAESLNTLFTAL